jgi:DNA-binding response OmpR family regulator
MTSLLVVEDDQDLQHLLRLGLEEHGFDVSTALDGPTGLESFHSSQPDLVISDVLLGADSFDGFELCRRIRQSSDVPVIFLSVLGEDTDHLVGLAVGADDYLVKPISPRLLSARVNMALGHRLTRGDPENQNPEKGLIIDDQSRSVTVDGTTVDLTRIEFELLLLLAAAPGRVVTREQITSHVWGKWYGSDAHLDVHMSRLRKKILDAGGPRVGHSVRGIGFKLF